MHKLQTLLIGFCMGIADLIPGVSGGTIAFISGVYEKLITSISSFNLTFLKLFVTGKRKSARKHINGKFLITLFTGIFLALILGSGLIHRALTAHPIIVMVFFVGLIVASILALLKEHQLTTRKLVILFIIGLLIGLLLTSVLNITIPSGLIGLLIAGLAGSIAMILPGISGSYILLIIGAYERIMGHIFGFIGAITTGDSQAVGFHLWPIITIAGGILIGIVLMSNILKWLLSKWHDEIILFLIGVMTGSLPALIPSLQDIKQQRFFSLLFFVLGIAIVRGFFSVKRKREGKE